MEMIGKGEVATLNILKEIFGKFAEYHTQCPLTEMVSDEYYDTFSGRQVKETIDIVVYTFLTPPIAIRVQDKHHTSVRMAKIDDIQKKMLEWNGWQVVDVWEYECKILWKDKVNIHSRNELRRAFTENGVNID